VELLVGRIEIGDIGDTAFHACCVVAARVIEIWAPGSCMSST
jgi:hypothetical protein